MLFIFFGRQVLAHCTVLVDFYYFLTFIIIFLYFSYLLNHLFSIFFLLYS